MHTLKGLMVSDSVMPIGRLTVGHGPMTNIKPCASWAHQNCWLRRISIIMFAPKGPNPTLNPGCQAALVLFLVLSLKESLRRSRSGLLMISRAGTIWEELSRFSFELALQTINPPRIACGWN